MTFPDRLLVKHASPVAWQHVNLYGRNNSVNNQSLWMWTKSFGSWLKSGSEPRPLWRRDPGLNLLAGICKKPIKRESAKKSGVRCPRPSAVLRVEYLARSID